MSARRILALLAAAVALGMASLAPSAATADDRSANRVTVAIIGDVPYGDSQEAMFGQLVNAVNADPKVRRVVHVGDTKSGSTLCTDERLFAIRTAFDSFEDPVVYTPGDNEWTDCHRPAAGGYDPLERLATIRSLYFSQPGSTLGRHPGRVDFQPQLVEDVRWVQSRVVFATLHVVGSNNGLAPWTGNTVPTAAQAAEVAARVDATTAWVDTTFDVAERDGLEGVVLMMQADTFPADTGQQAVVDRIASRAGAFDGPVLLVQGDSHQYLVDHPLGLSNVTRIVVHGETLPFEYLRLTIDPRNPARFSWERVPVAGR
jgi:hypothetical protein